MLFEALELARMIPSRSPFSYQTSKLEEDPVRLLEETLADSFFRSLQTQSQSYQGMFPGREYYANAVMDDRRGIFKDILVYGPCYFAWVINRSGGTLAQGALASWMQSTITNIDSGAVGSITKAATWTADEEVGGLLICTDDAGGAGAAPEGEGRVIVRNTANTLYVQPDFSAAPAANDDFVIRTNSKVDAAAAGDTRAEVAGVVIAPDGIPDNYWGWICTQGRVAALVKAATAIATDKSLIADAGRLTISSTSDNGLSLGYSLADVKADSVSDLIWAYLDCRSVLAVTA
jgi:hypothetical protein